MSRFAELLQRGITLQDVQELQRWLLTRVGQQWKRIALFTILGAGLGLGGLILKPAQFKASMIIAVEEGETSGWQNLLAQFGLDVGGLNPGGIFEGEALVQLFSTRYMVERTLLDKVYLKGDSVQLVNYLYPYTNFGSCPFLKPRTPTLTRARSLIPPLRLSTAAAAAADRNF